MSEVECVLLGISILLAVIPWARLVWLVVKRVSS